MITEEQYQDVIQPFVEQDAYYPSTLQEFVIFSKHTINPDISDFENMLGIVQFLLQINSFICPVECKVIYKQIIKQINPDTKQE